MNDIEGDNSGQETVSADCYDPANIGKKRTAQGCDGLLIVDNHSLRQMVLNDENYADTNIFTGQVTDMSYLFCTNIHNNNCTQKKVKYSISNWNTYNVNEIRGMFYNENRFNQNLNNWDVSKIKNMSYIFKNTQSFNQPLNNWNVSNVTNMLGMFEKSSFNQPLDNWKLNSIGSRDEMDNMFQLAKAFNQDISTWCVARKNYKPQYFDKYSGFEDNDDLQPKCGEPCY